MIPVKCAVIGLGKMGLLHGSILSAIPNVEIVAVCEKSSILLRIAKRLFPTAELVDDIAKLDGSSISTAYVTTPINSHFGIINNLLSHRIVDNIFVEKTWSVECKSRSALTIKSWYDKLKSDTQKFFPDEDRIKILLTKEKGKHGELIVISTDDFFRILNPKYKKEIEEMKQRLKEK